MVNNCKYYFIEKALYDGPSANLRPLFYSNMTKVSVLKWHTQILKKKLHAQQVILTFSVMPNTPILIVLYQF